MGTPRRPLARRLRARDAELTHDSARVLRCYGAFGAFGASVHGAWRVQAPFTSHRASRTTHLALRHFALRTSHFVTVLRLVIRQAARLATVGVVVGLTITFGVLQVLSTVIRLQRVTLIDIVAFGGGFLVVMVATALAAYQPARRATRVDPAQTLRADA